MKIRQLLAAAAASFSLALSHPVVAQTYEKIEGKATEEVPAVPFVGIAYGFIWVAILVYVVSVARGLAKTRSELDELRRKVDEAAGQRR